MPIHPDYADFSQEMTRGDHRNIRFQVIDLSDVVQNTSGWLKFWITGKLSLSDADPGVFQLTSTAGKIVAIDTSTGQHEGRLEPSHTQALTNEVNVLYVDIQGQSPDSKIWTLLKGELKVEPESTLATS